MPKLVKVVAQADMNRWLITAIGKTQASFRASDADAKRFDGIPRDELDRLLEEAMKRHAWLLKELAKR